MIVSGYEQEMRSRLHEFRRELRQRIVAPDTGMLLHASEAYDSNGRRLGAFDINKNLVAFNGDIPIGVYEANGEVRSFEQGLPLDQQGNFVIYDGQGTLLASFGEASELNHGDANLVREYAEQNQQLAKASFQLVSGRYQREFVTLWELFDHDDLAAKCMDMLALQARLIRRDAPYDGIITCTPIADLLMERIHAKLEEDFGVASLHYLGNFPFINPYDKNVLNFSGRSILIMSDIVASGSLVKTLAEQVATAGGEVAGALCVAVIDGDHIDKIRESRADVSKIKYKEPDGKSKDLQLFSLTDFLIEKSDKRPDRGLVREIDPITVLPLDENSEVPVASLVDERRMLEHFEQADAISFSFFEKQNYYFTTAIRIHRLINRCGDEIWQSIRSNDGGTAPRFLNKERHDQDNKLIVVTTYDRDDLAFQAFISEETYRRRRPF